MDCASTGTLLVIMDRPAAMSSSPAAASAGVLIIPVYPAFSFIDSAHETTKDVGNVYRRLTSL
jgi:hypothetical protein